MIFGKKKKSKEPAKRTPWVDDLVDDDFDPADTETAEDPEDQADSSSWSESADLQDEDSPAAEEGRDWWKEPDTDPAEESRRYQPADSAEDDPAENPGLYRTEQETEVSFEENSPDDSLMESDEDGIAGVKKEKNRRSGRRKKKRKRDAEDGRDAGSIRTGDDEYHLEQPEEDDSRDRQPEETEKKSFWKRLTFFSRLSIILLLLSVVMVLVFYLMDRIPSMAAAVVQIVIILIALLFHNNKLHSSKKWINQITILLLAILLMAGNIYFCARKVLHSRDVASRNEVVQSETESAEEMIVMPLGTDDCIGQSYSDIYKELKDAGFTSVDCVAVEDLQYDETDLIGTVSSVLIGSESTFLKNQEYAAGSTIVIYYHDYKKSNLDVSIIFDGNILFNKYDLDLYLNDSLKGTLEHGEDTEFLFQEKPGEITLRFEKSGDADIFEEYTLELQGDTELTLVVSCDKDAVNIEVQSIEEMQQSSSDEQTEDSTQSSVSADSEEIEDTDEEDTVTENDSNSETEEDSEDDGSRTVTRTSTDPAL